MDLRKQPSLLSNSYVSFCDREKGRIKGISIMVCPGLPCLNDVLLAEGFTSNLIIISQLCDQGLNVNFSKSKCLVTTKYQEFIMRGLRSTNNCYMWIPQLSSCMLSKVDETKLWHQRLGHLILKGMKKVIFVEANKGLPSLKVEEGKIYGGCQICSRPRCPIISSSIWSPQKS